MLMEMGLKSGDPDIITGLAKMGVTSTGVNPGGITDDLVDTETLLAEAASRRQGRVRTYDLHGFKLHVLYDFR